MCEGIETDGEWLLEELEHHINVKELLAAFFAVQSFYPLHKNVLHILLKIDNSTAVANINNYGSIKSPGAQSTDSGILGLVFTIYLVNKPTVHPMGKKLRLAAWILSASISERETFLSKQPN